MLKLIRDVLEKIYKLALDSQAQKLISANEFVKRQLRVSKNGASFVVCHVIEKRPSVEKWCHLNINAIILKTVLFHCRFNHNACQKSWNTSANFALFCDFPLSPSDQCCFLVKILGSIGMTGRSATLLESWDDNPWNKNQHCFGGEGSIQTWSLWLEMRIMKK